MLMWFSICWKQKLLNNLSYQGLMSRNLVKKFGRTPIRSPSPDFVNHNLIVSTSFPTVDIAKRQRSETANNPLITKNLPQSYELEKEIKQLQEKNRKLSREKSSLQEDNTKYIKQINFLKGMNMKSQTELLKKKSEAQIQHHLELSNQYQSKIADLMLEIKRIQNCLQIQIKHNDILIRENQTLKRQLEENRNKSHEETVSFRHRIVSLQQKLSESFEQRLQEYQTKVDLVMNDLIRKFNRMQNHQIILRTTLENKKNYQSPNPAERKSTEETPPAKKKYPQNTTDEDHATEEHQSKIRQPIVCQNCLLYLKQIEQLTSGQAQQSNLMPHINTSISKQQNSHISNELLNHYKQQVEQIKFLLIGQKVQSFNHDDKLTLDQLESIDEKFQSMIDEKNNIIQEFKQKEIRLQMELISLKKEIGILKVQTKQQNEEIIQLNVILSQRVQSFTKRFQGNIEAKNQQPIGQTHILRQFLQQATLKIQYLESQIQKTLKE